MRISYNNYIDNLTSTAITALTESPTFPIANIQDQRLSMEYRTFNSVTSQSVIFDLGSVISISTCAIINHNFTSSCTVTISANTINTWTTAATTISVAFNSDMMLSFFNSISYQYWKLNFTDPTNTDGYLSMGRVWLGDYLTIDPSSEVDFSISKQRSDRVLHGSGNQKFSSIGIGWREFKLSFPETSYTMIDSINLMYDTVGLHSSFLFCNFDSIRAVNDLIEPCYCSIKEVPTFKHAEGRKMTYDLNLREEG